MQVELLETVTSALVCLLQAQPSLADQVPSLGHIPQLCKKMVTHRQQGAIIRATILVLHQLATSEVCMLHVVPLQQVLAPLYVCMYVLIMIYLFIY
jgi:DnaJ family protein C protein 13